MDNTDNSTNHENENERKTVSSFGAAPEPAKKTRGIKPIFLFIAVFAAVAIVALCVMLITPKHPVDIVVKAAVKTALMYKNEPTSAFLNQASSGGSLEFSISPSQILKQYGIMPDISAAIKLYSNKAESKLACTVEAGVSDLTMASAHLHYDSNALIIASEELFGSEVYGISFENFEEKLQNSIFDYASGTDYAFDGETLELISGIFKNYSRSHETGAKLPGVYGELYTIIMDAIKDNAQAELTKIKDEDMGEATLVTVKLSNESIYATIEQVLKALSENEALRQEFYELIDLNRAVYSDPSSPDADNVKYQIEEFLTTGLEENLLELKKNICEDADSFLTVVNFYITSGYINKITAEHMPEGEGARHLEYTAEVNKNKIEKAVLAYKYEHYDMALTYANQKTETGQIVSFNIKDCGEAVADIQYIYTKADKSYVCTVMPDGESVYLKLSGGFEYTGEAAYLSLDGIYYNDGYTESIFEPGVSIVINKKAQMPAAPADYKDILTMGEEEFNTAISEIYTSVQVLIYQIMILLG